ncbi:FAD/NAD(P)-binding protein [Candidatus Sumerlaeota bacterium]|nr:FAD/NAD(P)-binding protein [Candidatus Sumerlaeota bacterium]
MGINPYTPYPVTIKRVVVENEDKDIKSFELVFTNPEHEKAFNYLPGQFAEISVWGYGECPIGMASSPTEKGILRFTVKKTGGVVTTALHNLQPGRQIGVRGPLGNSYPVNEIKGKNIFIIGGGFAFTTLRSLLTYLIHPDNRNNYADITVIYGARSPGELIYKDEIALWQQRDDLNVYITVDKADEHWDGLEGFVPTIAEQVIKSWDNGVAFVCGPPIMIKFTIPVLLKAGFPPELIYTSLEMRMKCGIGKCGRCNIGPKYVCKHGPIFTFAELQQLPSEY